MQIQNSQNADVAAESIPPQAVAAESIQQPPPPYQVNVDTEMEIDHSIKNEKDDKIKKNFSDSPISFKRNDVRS